MLTELKQEDPSRAGGETNSPEAKPAGSAERRVKTSVAGVAGSSQRSQAACADSSQRGQAAGAGCRHLTGRAGYLPGGEKSLKGPEL